MIEAGHKAPTFELPTDRGKTVSLAGLAGKTAVMFFYPKDDTSGCTMEAKDFSNLAADFAAAGAVIVGISPDSVKSHCRFRDKHSLAVTLAADEAKVALTAYGVWQEKSMYGRKYMGVERTTVLVDGAGRIARIWRKVKVPGHAAEVLGAARGLIGARG